MKSIFSRFKGSHPPGTNPQPEKENRPPPVPPKKRASGSLFRPKHASGGSAPAASRATVRSPTPISIAPASPASPPSPASPTSPLSPIRPLSPIITHPAPALASAAGGAGADRRPYSVQGPPSVQHLPLPSDTWEDRRRTVSASGGAGALPGQGPSGHGKKVTFRSPPPTPTASVVLDSAVDYDGGDSSVGQEVGGGRPVSRASARESLPANSLPQRKDSLRAVSRSDSLPPAPRDEPSSSTLAAPPAPRRTSSPFLPTWNPRPSSRKASLPPLSKPFHNPSASASASASLDSGGISPTKHSMLFSPTPSDHSIGSASTRSYLPPPNSWSEMADQELIANLGPKERTRQEVLWEIVSSEERYVHDLLTFNETFLKVLVPSNASPHLDLYDPTATLTRQWAGFSRGPTPSPSLHGGDSYAHLPIAAKYASSSQFRSPSDSSASSAPPVTPSEEFPGVGFAGLSEMGAGLGFGGFGSNPGSARRMAYNSLTNGSGRPASPLSASRKPSMSSLKHHSLPPLPRTASALGSGGAAGAGGSRPPVSSRMSYQPPNKLHKTRDGATSRVSSGGSTGASAAGPSLPVVGKDLQLPEELATVLKALSGGILEGHLKLAAALRKRFDDQFPLVRSLADIFNAHSSILREYSNYVLHLEKALAQIDDALALFTDPSAPHTRTTKRLSRRVEDTPLGKLARLLLSLEELAAERGEAGLVISLSKPFQRLLKYPLMFQNLLFNTDPSLKEYERTLGMVDEVEVIVRSIEDEKTGWEERERTRDVWARVEGLEKDRMLMVPKPNRILISETQLSPPESKAAAALAAAEAKAASQKDRTVKQKKSMRRLSDMLKGGSTGEPDLWVVRFTDMSLLCAKVGVTTLPMSTVKRDVGEGDGEDKEEKRDRKDREKGRGKYATVGRRSARARNLYRFVKIHEWHLRASGAPGAMVDMDEIAAERQQASATSAPRTTPAQRTTPEHTPEDSPSDEPTPQPLRTLTSIPGTPHTTPTKIPLKATDGAASGNPSPSKIRPSRLRELELAAEAAGEGGGGRGRAGDTDTVYSESGSVMSFAFVGAEQVKATRRVRPVAGRTAGGLGSGGAAGTGAGAGTGRKPLGASSTLGGAAKPNTTIRARTAGTTAKASLEEEPLRPSEITANAKFAHRLRSPEDDAIARGEVPPGGVRRPMSKARRSLPPAMTMVPGPGERERAERAERAGQAERAGSVAGGASTRSGAAGAAGAGTTGTTSVRPAWNSGMSTVSKRASTPASIASARVRPGSTVPKSPRSPVSPRAPGTTTPTAVATARGTTATTTAGTGTPRTRNPSGQAAPPPSALGNKRTQLAKVESTDSGLAEIWKAYGDVDKLGSSGGTPRKIGVRAGMGAGVGGKEIGKEAGKEVGKEGTPSRTGVRTPVGRVGVNGTTTAAAARAGPGSVAGARRPASGLSTQTKPAGTGAGPRASTVGRAAGVGAAGSAVGAARKRDLGGRI
ncbi:hypothetical protein IAT38_000967 [Cryptococcus sp. DSM 104549]